MGSDSPQMQTEPFDTYLQFLHFSPNNIPFPHTVHVWDIQYLVENLQAKEKRFKEKKTNSLILLHLFFGAPRRRTVVFYARLNGPILAESFCDTCSAPCLNYLQV